MTGIHLKNTEIILDGKKTRYQVGDYVHGKLIISLNGELALSAVKIGLICLAKLKTVENTNRFISDGHDSNGKYTILDHTFELPPRSKIFC